MAKESTKSAEAIENLLEARLKIEQWLNRLGQTGNSTPQSVRERVESDYRRRLQQVVTELQSYRDEILAALDRHKTVRSGLLRQENDATERLAEAELRHVVGEFTEAQWNELQADILGSLEKIRDELRSVGGEVSALEEVMALLAPGPGEARRVSGAFGKLSQRDTEARGAGAEVGAPAAADLDDLDFLKSVTEDEVQGPTPTRASGEMRMPDDVADVLISHQSHDGGVRNVGAEDVTSFADAPGQPKKGVAKTLKCGECGAMNLPTEWYCERCGAELAAL